VPALVLETGELFTECPAIAQLIADKVPDRKMAPARDSSERYRLQEWLNFITSELHKNFTPLFSPVLGDDAKTFFRDRVFGKLKFVDAQLAGREYLMDKQFTVADCYLYTMLTWADRVKMDISTLPNLISYKIRVSDRPKVKEALIKEGLLKAS